MYAVIGRGKNPKAIFNSKWHAEDWANFRKDWKIKRISVREEDGVYITRIHKYEFLTNQN